MRLSTRNQLTGTVTEVNLGTVMATVKVKLDGGEQLVTASVTKEAAEDLGLSVGAAVTVLVKSTEVMLGVEYHHPTPGGVADDSQPPAPARVVMGGWGRRRGRWLWC